ncbi:hypothetical protein IFM89_032047 [Coptis chinensis]|uniref:Uncharacterized protein n=1 Tax=Coptis chinensis TaxID=261450 RepID=A0A835LWZ5_9MAGN|nr:hypothetical protein IFM89_032047 [Coptis chinensis]
MELNHLGSPLTELQSSITQTTEPSNVSIPLNLPGSFTSLLNTPGADFVGLGFDNMGPGVWSSLMMNYGHFGGNTWQLGNDCHAALVDGDCINALARSYQKIAQVVHQSSPSLR